MKIKWNKVTWYSKLLAVVVFLFVLLVGFYIGRIYQEIKNPLIQSQVITSQNSDQDMVFGAQNEFVKEGDNWVLYDYSKNKMGLVLPVQKEPYYNEEQHLKYMNIPIEYEISPDTKKIIYLAKEGGDTELGQQLLYVANTNGTTKEVLARPEWNYAHGAIDNFFWSVDSKHIIYRDAKGDEGGSAYDLYKINIETKKKTKLDSGSIQHQYE